MAPLSLQPHTIIPMITSKLTNCVSWIPTALFSSVFLSLLILYIYIHPCQATQHQSIYFISEIHQSWQLFQINPDGSDLQQTLTTDTDVLSLSLTANGQNLLFTTSDRKIHLLDLETREKIEIKSGMKGMVDAVLSKDNKSLLFSLSSGGSNDANHIWLTDLATKKATQLTHMEDMQHSPIWSHDDKYIIFLSGGGKQNEDIWRLDIKSGSLTQLTAGQLYNFEPACSINNEIAFSSNRSGNYEIWVMDPFGSSARQLTHNEGMDSQPSWSPEGEDLVFVSNRDGQPALYIMDREGKTNRKISPDGLNCRNPVWGR